MICRSIGISVDNFKSPSRRRHSKNHGKSHEIFLIRHVRRFSDGARLCAQLKPQMNTDETQIENGQARGRSERRTSEPRNKPSGICPLICVSSVAQAPQPRSSSAAFRLFLTNALAYHPPEDP